jgi:hypothetical protein
MEAIGFGLPNTSDRNGGSSHLSGFEIEIIVGKSLLIAGLKKCSV